MHALFEEDGGRNIVEFWYVILPSDGHIADIPSKCWNKTLPFPGIMVHSVCITSYFDMGPILSNLKQLCPVEFGIISIIIVRNNSSIVGIMKALASETGAFSLQCGDNYVDIKDNANLRGHAVDRLPENFLPTSASSGFLGPLMKSKDVLLVLWNWCYDHWTGKV